MCTLVRSKSASTFGAFPLVVVSVVVFSGAIARDVTWLAASITGLLLSLPKWFMPLDLVLLMLLLLIVVALLLLPLLLLLFMLL